MDPTIDPTITEAPLVDTIDREVPDPAEARKALVNHWTTAVLDAREYWEARAFRQMRLDMAFCAGQQWEQYAPAGATPDASDANYLAPHEKRYTANIVLRHISARTASIYGKNPKIVSRRKTRLVSTVWDGSALTLQVAQAAAQANPADPIAMAVVNDALNTMADNQMKTRMGRTLELLFEHEIDEQPLPFKVQMKALVRRALTTGVGYARPGYQRIMGYPPGVDAQIDTFTRQLATMEQVTADMAQGAVKDTEAEAEQVRLLTQALADAEATSRIILREGLTITYPHSTAIIPDKAMQQVRGFVGARFVAEEYFLTAADIKKIYRKDVTMGASAGSSDGAAPRAYSKFGEHNFRADTTDHLRNPSSRTADHYYCVWEIFSRDDGLVYTVCDGYGDFLADPSPPDTPSERFYPWFAFVVNEVYAENKVFPPSDVFLMRHQQMEINRSREGQRQHRRAALPKTYVRKGLLSDTDRAALGDPTPHLVVELEALAPQEKIDDVLQVFRGSGVDPSLYDPSAAYEDYLRVLGQQEANLGGTSGATATEASIAEGSRVSGVSAVVDDLDEFLTEFARAAGAILFAQCRPDQVRQIVGPGAVWPETTADEVSKEIYLEIEAASTGRPNQAQQVQSAQQLFPMLMQIPGLSPEWLAKELLRRLDDKLDLTDAFTDGVPSIMALNRTMGMAGATSVPTAMPPGQDPAAQGSAGADNLPSTEPPQVNIAPREPNPVGRPPMVPLP